MKNLILTIFILMTSISSIMGSHAAGGEIFYECTGPNTYNIYIRMFRDCNAFLTLPTTVDVGLYDQVTHATQATWTISQLTNNQDLDLGDACYTPTGLCVDEAIYGITNVTIPDNPNGYYMETHINTRNALADNLLNPDDYTLIFFAELSDPALGQNSSPDFGFYPADSYFCTTIAKDLVFPVSEADGDSLVFSFVEPMGNTLGTGTASGTGAYPFYDPVPWAGGFSLANIYNGVDPMTIDDETGVIYTFPDNQGTYAFVVRIEEYRNGVKMGEIRRDVQFAALACDVDTPPTISTNDSIAVYYGESNCVDVQVEDADGVDTIYVTPSSNNFDLAGNFVAPDQVGGNFVYSNWNGTTNDEVMTHFDQLPNGLFQGVGKISLRYCWTADCESIENENYIDLLGYSLGCSGSDTAEQRVNFVVKPSVNMIASQVPNVFTPNADGDNDTYKMIGTPDPCYDSLSVQIFNRWGKEVFSSDDPYFEWDGTMKGKGNSDCAEGTYMLIIKGTYGTNYDPTLKVPVPIEIEEQFTIQLLR